jgi:hypothetical protein
MAAQITGGVDTHLDVHVVAALDELGALVGVESFPTTPVGYRAVLGWLRSHGEVVVVGVEGAAATAPAWPAISSAKGWRWWRVDRPNRQRRRRQGKTDPYDAVTAARAVQAGDARGAAKLRDGNVEAIRGAAGGARWRQAGRQLGALADRDQPALPRPDHPALPPTPSHPRQHQDRNHPLPQALRRPPALPPAPTTTTGLTPPRSINLCAFA